MLAEALVAVSIAVAPVPTSPTVVAMETAPPTPACTAVGGYLSAWQARLELRDWSIGYFCRPDPELGDEAEGTAEMNRNERVVAVHIHPAAPDQEEVAVHELVHIWLGYVGEADSDLVEEQAVRIFTRLLIAGNRCTSKGAP